MSDLYWTCTGCGGAVSVFRESCTPCVTPRGEAASTPVERATSIVLADIASWLPGWDGPIPTRDNLHDLVDANMIIHDACIAARAYSVHDEPWFDDTSGAIFDAVFAAVLAAPQIDTDATPAMVSTYYTAMWANRATDKDQT